MKVTILLGSVRKGRQSHRAAHYIARNLQVRGIDTDLIDLARSHLPIFGTEEHSGPEAILQVESISTRLMQADAIILVTPEYHGSFSGVLKNALDYFRIEFHRKPVGVIATSTGRMAGINASTQLQHVILSMGAFPLPIKLLIPDVENAFTTTYEPKNERIIEITDKFIREFLWFAEALYHKKMKERVA